MYRDETKPQMRMVFSLKNKGVNVESFHLQIQPGEGAPVAPSVHWDSLVPILLKYLIEQFVKPSMRKCIYGKDSLGPNGEDCFLSGWGIAKNHFRGNTSHFDVAKGRHYRRLKYPRAAGDKTLIIQIDPLELPPGNISLSVADERHASSVPLFHPPQWQAVLEHILGERSITRSELAGDNPVPSESGPFMFGTKPTQTFVPYSFPQGLSTDAIECVPAPDSFTVPKEIMSLVDKAYAIVKASSTSTIHDAPVFAPLRIERIEDYGGSRFESLRIWLAVSEYRIYTAFAFADVLAERDQQFVPLRSFVQKIENPALPSQASASLGTRIMIETEDDAFVVAHRSRAVKMNPNVWSASCNEGVRPDSIPTDDSFSRILERAVYNGIYNELGVRSDHIKELQLLSVYQNSYAQWGATFYAKTVLTFKDVKSRQLSATHRGEHDEIAAIPTDLRRCGRAMADLGIRWYGGALESICSALSYRNRLNDVHIAPEDVARVLDDDGGGHIMPCDEINPIFLKALDTNLAK